MISRLTASAALFAILAPAGLGGAADALRRPAATPVAATPSTIMITLPMVVITGKRTTRS